ncbi:MAG TPA: potassium-transporting ATPase subunit KdpA [Candidatus Methylomirabilis sp.]|nr:potassium-transporting ATPase subunit KdpA [Candidatus Methylomirabilis sp.]
MWLLPFLILVTAVALSIPLSRYLAWVMDGNYRPPRWLQWFERRVDSGPQDWKHYTVALLVFNTVLFVYGFIVLALQPLMPLNPLGRGMLAPTTIFHSVISFMTNTDLQHYAGDQHLSNWSQIFFVIPNLFLSAAVGLCALTAIIRALRGEETVGNFFLDMWRVVVYTFLPIALIAGILFIHQGMPMTYRAAHEVAALEPGAMGFSETGEARPQRIVVGPLAAFVPIKMLGTNGGGFYGMNSAHPLENPSAWTNVLTTLLMMLFPMALVLMYGRMLGRLRHAVVIYAVMLSVLVSLVGWSIYWDTLRGNPALTARAAPGTFEIASASAPGGKLALTIPAVAGLPVDQRLGNLEGKELRFGTSAGATFAAVTTTFTCGAVNCELDSLNPLAALSPFVGMWLNCIYGGKGVGMINFLVFLIIGIFVTGQMVGRSPEYLGRKVGAREMKLAMLALLVHPIMILGPSGLFAATAWGTEAVSNPGAHGLSQIVFQFSSSSANNGAAFNGLGVTYGFNNNPNPAPMAVPWDIAGGLVMLFGRYLPIVAPIALAAGLGRKKRSPMTTGTLRDDTPTFGFLLLGTILIIGALLFLPVAALGPLAEHLGPIPFGG